MQLELNNHKITLGPKALAFVETAYRAKGEYLDQCAAIYCRDQLELWRAGGECDPDVTVIGPARFVAKGNEIGIGMMPKAGVAPASVAESKTGSKEPLPVASAAPAGSEWPKWKRDCGFGIARLASPTRGDGAYYRLGAGCEPAAEYWWDDRIGVAGVPGPEAAKWLRANGHAKVADELERPATADLYEPVCVQPRKGDRMHNLRTGDTEVAVRDAKGFAGLPGEWETPYATGILETHSDGTGYRILKRQATPAHGLQVWRAADRCIWIFDGNGVSLAWLGVSGSWYKARIGRVRPSDALVTGPEADAAIKEARAQGVLS